MRSLRSPRLVLALLVAGAAAPPAQADGALALAETRLHTPPDSHEPQRALVELRNSGAEAQMRVALLCTFTGAGGSVLDTQTTVVPDIAARTTVQAEAIYYGWPRASGAACRLAEPR